MKHFNWDEMGACAKYIHAISCPKGCQDVLHHWSSALPLYRPGSGSKVQKLRPRRRKKSQPGEVGEIEQRKGTETDSSDMRETKENREAAFAVGV